MQRASGTTSVVDEKGVRPYRKYQQPRFGGLVGTICQAKDLPSSLEGTQCYLHCHPQRARDGAPTVEAMELRQGFGGGTVLLLHVWSADVESSNVTKPTRAVIAPNLSAIAYI